MNMGHETLLIARLFFWMFTAGTVLLPGRWAVLSYLLLVQFDLTGSAFYSSEILGWENAVKVIVVPTILFFRLRPIDFLNSNIVKVGRIWILLAAYAALAVLWSPFKLSAVKMLGYFYAYTVLFIVFAAAWRRGWLTANALISVLWASLAFAVLQTYVLGNTYGSFEAANAVVDFEWRFTSFTGAQSFAAFLLCILTILLFRERWKLSVLAACAGATIGIVLTGSRSIFLGFAWILTLVAVLFSKKAGYKISLAVVARRMALSFVALLVVAAGVLKALPENRLNEMLSAAVTSENSLQDVGTFMWRFSLYQKTLDELVGRSLKTKLLGSGTSSAAGLVLQTGFFSESNVDPNRALHDEFLRSAYEWGAIGIVLLLAFLIQAVVICLRLIRDHDSGEAWTFLAVLVPLLISLAVENFLADSASPGGVAYNLVLSSMLACGSLHSRSAAAAAAPSSVQVFAVQPTGTPGAWSTS
jgi:O-Antigen ligase